MIQQFFAQTSFGVVLFRFCLFVLLVSGAEARDTGTSGTQDSAQTIELEASLAQRAVCNSQPQNEKACHQRYNAGCSGPPGTDVNSLQYDPYLNYRKNV